MLGEWDRGDATLLEAGRTEEIEARASARIPNGRDRRVEPRYEVTEDRLWIEWREADNFYGRSARLVNVSRHGAMVVASVPLRAGQKLRLYLEEPAPQDAVFATVVGILEGRQGFHQLRVHFQAPCPDSFIDAAALGFEKWLAQTQMTA
jgi:hypothetical protein